MDYQRSAVSIYSQFEPYICRLFYSAFCKYRPNRINFAPNLFDDHGVYDAFVDNELSSGFAFTLTHYTPQINAIGSQIDNAIEFTTKTISLLIEDARLIADCMGWKDFSARELLNIAPGLSDPHEFHRTVCRLNFKKNRSIIYKPRNLYLEILFFDLIQHLNEQNSDGVANKYLRAASKSRYGWQEYCEILPVESARQTAEYFYRCGTLIACAHICALTDCHGGNLVANGRYPVLVDTETVGHPRPREEAFARCLVGHMGAGHEDVLRASFVPEWAHQNSETDEPRLAQSGLSRSDLVGWKTPRIQWMNAHCDGLYPLEDFTSPIQNFNLPHDTRSRTYSPTEYVDEICCGFESAYKSLANTKQYIFDLIDKIPNDARIRFIFRDTDDYYSLINYHWDQMISGADKSHDVQSIIGGVYQKFSYIPSSILHAELESIKTLNVPRFSSSFASADGIICGGSSAGWPLVSSPKDVARAQIESLNDCNREKQSAILRRSLESLSLTAPVGAVSSKQVAGSKGGVSAISWAILVGEQILGDRCFDDGRLDIYGLQRVPDSRQYRYGRLESGLYQGSLGVLMFLLELGEVAKDVRFSDFARTIVDEIARNVIECCDADPRLVLDLSESGLVNGLGGLIYSLSIVGGRYEVGRASEAASRLVNLLPNRERFAAPPIDVFNGLAGDLLGLCAYHRWVDDECSGSAVKDAESELLDGCARLGEGEHHYGFAHGYSGIANALRESYKISENEKCPKYVEKLFNKEFSYWMNFDFSESSQLFSDRCSTYLSWCNGVGGFIILAKKLGSKYLEKIEYISTQFNKMYIEDNLTVCCGRSGHLMSKDFVSNREISPNTDDPGVDPMIIDRIRTEMSSNWRYNYSLFSGISGYGLYMTSRYNGNLWRSIISMSP